jgi:hypothetical protein
MFTATVLLGHELELFRPFSEHARALIITLLGGAEQQLAQLAFGLPNNFSRLRERVHECIVL